jgi:hypothetical protein
LEYNNTSIVALYNEKIRKQNLILFSIDPNLTEVRKNIETTEQLIKNAEKAGETAKVNSLLDQLSYFKDRKKTLSLQKVNVLTEIDDLGISGNVFKDFGDKIGTNVNKFATDFSTNIQDWTQKKIGKVKDAGETVAKGVNRVTDVVSDVVNADYNKV